jgi:hypothetical protein
MAIAFQGDLRPCNMVAEQVASSGRDTRCTRPRFTPAGGYAGRLHDDRPRREEGPCPGDAYGSHSLRRARRLLTYIEDRPHRLPGAGRRIVTLVELAWATAPGDPNVEELPAQQGCSSSALCHGRARTQKILCISPATVPLLASLSRARPRFTCRAHFWAPVHLGCRKIFLELKTLAPIHHGQVWASVRKCHRTRSNDWQRTPKLGKSAIGSNRGQDLNLRLPGHR